MNRTKLEIILLKFAIDVLDNANGKNNNTLGELIDKPLNEILALADELYLDEDDHGITEEKVARAEVIRDSLREDGISV